MQAEPGAVARQNRRGHGSLRAHASIAWESAALDREILASDLVAEKLQLGDREISGWRRGRSRACDFWRPDCEARRERLVGYFEHPGITTSG